MTARIWSLTLPLILFLGGLVVTIPVSQRNAEHERHLGEARFVADVAGFAAAFAKAAAHYRETGGDGASNTALEQTVAEVLKAAAMGSGGHLTAKAAKLSGNAEMPAIAFDGNNLTARLRLEFDGRPLAITLAGDKAWYTPAHSPLQGWSIGAGLSLLLSLFALLFIQTTKDKRQYQEGLKLGQGMLEASLDAIMTFNDKFHLASCNSAACQSFGYDREEVLGLPLETLIPERFRDAHRLHVAGFHKSQLMAKRMNERSPIICRRKDGSEFYAEATITKVNTSSGWIFTAILRDVTERITREKEEAKNRKRLRAVIDTSRDGVLTINSNGEIIEYNPAAERILGWPASEMMGKNIKETIIPPRMRPLHDQGMNHYLRTGEHKVLNQRLELPALHQSGREILIEIVITPVTLERELLFTSYFRESSEQQQKGRRLAAEETNKLSPQGASDLTNPLFVELLEAGNVAVFAVDPKFRITSWNTVLAETTGYGNDEMKGREMAEIASTPESTEKIRALLQQAMTNGRGTPCQVELHTKEEIPVVILLNAINKKKNTDGSEGGALVIGQIVTEMVWQQRILETAIKQKTTELELLSPRKS